MTYHGPDWNKISDNYWRNKLTKAQSELEWIESIECEGVPRSHKNGARKRVLKSRIEECIRNIVGPSE